MVVCASMSGAARPVGSRLGGWIEAIRMYRDQLVSLAGLLLIFLFNGLKFLHLDADFPSGITTSRALYTDEGWYALNAVNRGVQGTWYAPGELNSIVNLPIGSILQAGAFQLLVISLITARGLVAAASIVLVGCIFLLVRRYASEGAALATAVLVSIDFFLFAYARLAILDLVAAALVGLALIVAARAALCCNVVGSVLAGLVLGLAALTKTTALCALLAVAYLCANRAATPRRGLALAGSATGVFI